MHEPVLTRLREWVASFREEIDRGEVADLGGRNFNGCLKDIVKHAVAFDVREHESVDVVIHPNFIPFYYRRKFDVVVATNCLEYCERMHDFRDEVLYLLKPGGLFFMSSCAPGCPYTHGLGEEHVTEYKQYRKITRGHIEALFEGIFTEEKYVDLNTDILFQGRRLA